MTHSGNKLTVFIIASVIMHAVFILRGQYTLLLPSSEGSSMQVFLVGKAVSPKQLEENIGTITKPASFAEHTPLQQHTVPSKKVNTSTKKHQQHKQEMVKQGSNHLPAQPQIIAYIKHELRHHFHYPEMARRRGWQGRVVINLDVTATGEIENVTLQRSSGYSILDNAAISSVNKIGLIPFVKQSGYTGTHSIRLPIEYQLKG